MLQIPKYVTGVILDPTSMYDRIVVIGDIHGCFIEFSLLLEKIAPTERDLLISLGDLVDKGPNSSEVVSLVQNTGHFLTILGNHEEKHVRHEIHLSTSGKSPVKGTQQFYETHETLSKSQLEFMAGLPAYIGYRNWIFTHAGVNPIGDPFRQHTKSFIRNRFYEVKPDGSVAFATCKLNLETRKWEVPDNAKHWTDLYSGPSRVVYGHDAHKEAVVHSNTFGIDTGCVYGNKLTAMIVTDSEQHFVSVPAQQAYANWYREAD